MSSFFNAKLEADTDNDLIIPYIFLTTSAAKASRSCLNHSVIPVSHVQRNSADRQHEPRVSV